MLPTTYVHAQAQKILEKATPDRATLAAKIVQHETSIAKALKKWSLEPLAPITAAENSIIWLVHNEGAVLLLKLPLHASPSILAAHQRLDELELGPRILRVEAGSCMMLMERLQGQTLAEVKTQADGMVLHAEKDGVHTAKLEELRKDAKEHIEQLEMTLMETIRTISETDADSSAVDIANIISSQLARQQPQQSGSQQAEKALETLQGLTAAGWQERMCHGALRAENVIATPDGLRLTGPKGLKGDPHSDLASWLWETHITTSRSKKPNRERTKKLAKACGLDPERTHSWLEVLESARRAGPGGVYCD